MDDSYFNIDQQLLKAYQETIYQVVKPSISIEINVLNPILNAFLQENDAYSWAFITAWNPKSQLLSSKENKQKLEELVKMVKKAGYLYFPGKGIGKDQTWEPEQSLFILNITKAEAIRIGKYFDQNAIVFGDLLHLSELVLLI